MKNLALIFFILFLMPSTAIFSQTPGSLDNSFGTDGKILTKFSLLKGYEMYITSQALMENGNILAIVNKTYWDNNTSSSIDSFILYRFMPNGNIDNSFAINGRFLINFQVRNILVQTDKKILIFAEDDGETVILRMNENGMPDITFGSKGIFYTGLFQSLYSFCLQPDGKILLGGSFLSSSKMMLTRLEKDGSRDHKFGKDGILLLDFDTLYGGEYVRLITPQGDGKIIVIGSVYKSNNFTTVTRLTEQGRYDSTFNGNGKQTLSFSGLYANAVEIMTDQNIVIGGIYYFNNYSQSAIVIARLLPNGKMDTKFGLNGVRNTNFGGKQDFLLSMCKQPDGKLLCAGRSDTKFGMLRLTETGTLDVTFNTTGKVTTSFGSETSSTATKCSLMADGKILLIGYSYMNDSTSAFAMARYYSGLNLGINEPDPFPDLKAYPIPAHDQITLNFTLRQSTDISISLYNTQSQLVQVLLNVDKINSGNHSETLILKPLPPNLYYLEIKGDNFTKRLKVILN